MSMFTAPAKTKSSQEEKERKGRVPRLEHAVGQSSAVRKATIRPAFTGKGGGGREGFTDQHELADLLTL